MTNVETFYILQKEANTIKETWKNKLFHMGSVKSTESTQDFVNNWRVLLVKQNLLLSYYESIEMVLNNCE